MMNLCFMYGLKRGSSLLILSFIRLIKHITIPVIRGCGLRDAYYVRAHALIVMALEETDEI